MTKNRADVGARLLGEYVDEADLPPSGSYSRGEVQRPRIVARHVDFWVSETDEQEFNVLLRDRTVVKVHGHGLRYLEHAAGSTGSYAVLVRSGEREITVALFPVMEVTGIFRGDLLVAGDAPS